MLTTSQIPPPNANDENSIVRHKEQVLSAYGQLFDLIDQALRDSVPRASDLFRLLEGPMDLGVHAGNTRYLTRLFLTSRNVSTENEDIVEFELDRVPNCGLCLRGDGYEIRILKSSSEGIPKASSDARSRFYSSNQMQFTFARSQQQLLQPQMTLNLIVLWNMDDSYSYAGLEIACPRGEQKDGTVDCYWIARWETTVGRSVSSERIPVAAEPDLDEIRALGNPQAASS